MVCLLPRWQCRGHSSYTLDFPYITRSRFDTSPEGFFSRVAYGLTRETLSWLGRCKVSGSGFNVSRGKNQTEPTFPEDPKNLTIYYVSRGPPPNYTNIYRVSKPNNLCISRVIKTIPSLHLPSDKTRPSQHLPSDKTRPSLHIPSDKTRPSLHLPSDKTRPSSHLLSDKTISASPQWQNHTIFTSPKWQYHSITTSPEYFN